MSNIETNRAIRDFNNNQPPFHTDGEYMFPYEDEVLSPDKSREAMDNFEIVTVKDPETGQNIRLKIFNPEKLLERDPLIWFPQYNIDINHRGNDYTEGLIAALGQRSVIIVESLSVGESSDMTRSQKRGMLKDEIPFEKVSYSYLRVLKSFLEGKGYEGNIDLGGYSQGGMSALTAAVFAHEFGFSVGNVVCIENPGGRKFGKLGAEIGGAFAKEASMLFYYLNDPNDAIQREVGGIPDVKPKGIKKAYQDVLNNAKLGADIIAKSVERRGALSAYPRAMSKEVVPLMLKKILERKDCPTITFILGTESHISARKPLYGFINTLSEEDRKKIKLKILPGDTHSLGERARRMSWFVLNALGGGANKREFS